MDRELRELVARAWSHHRSTSSEPWLVEPSIPILFFGDLAAYTDSDIKIVTVALNPSNREFPTDDPFARFEDVGGDDEGKYISSLSAYFKSNPYTQWFDFFEQALSGMQSSYHPGSPRSVLHTDIGSCLPTAPTWSGLSREIRETLASDGVPLWHDLIAYLQPHVIILSVARQWLELISFDPLGEWHDLHVFDRTEAGELRKRPVVVEGRWYDVGDHQTLAAFVPASQKPLAALSHPQKARSGEVILEAWHAGP